MLLSARVSEDGQWCLPLNGDLPKDLIDCIVTFEDAYFYFHPGLNPVSLVKALYSYLKTGKITRGGSTIPMQVMRMRYKNSRRNVLNKAIESLSAIKYSLTRKKSTVLKDWAQLAPFGGNTIGVTSASLRYFGRDMKDLSWAEYALLAVMPNDPSSANLKVNRGKLIRKRDFLLNKLYSKGFFSKEDLVVYLSEELPDEWKQIPNEAPFFLDYLIKQHPHQYVYFSNCSAKIQHEVADLLEKEVSFLRHDDIRNGAAIVVDITTNELIAYVGNTRYDGKNRRNFVDIAQAPRSYGSLLKPFLYGYALENGYILPTELILDVPTVIGDFRPKNFDEKFRGAARADEIVLLSLNVPTVRLLNHIGLSGFYHFLRKLDPMYLNKGSDHYGLSLILGGGETSLWEMARLYKGLAQNYLGLSNPYEEINYLQDGRLIKKNIPVNLSAFSMTALVNAMADIGRPREDRFWYKFDENKKIAWKTGTSYGHRDAWAIGFNGKYMVAVWIGNENGEGRFDLTGISKAAPLMFQMFKTIPDNKWFAKEPTFSEKKVISICSESGKLAGKLCSKKEKKYVEKTSFLWQQCNYHKEAWTNKKGWIVGETCPSQRVMKDTFFTLPAEIEYYFRESNPFYKGLPPLDPECFSNIPTLSIIYPSDKIKIFLPKERSEAMRSLIAKAHHSIKDANVFWFLDDVHIHTGKAREDNLVCTLQPSIGHHQLTIIDQWGNRNSVSFEVLE